MAEKACCRGRESRHAKRCGNRRHAEREETAKTACREERNGRESMPEGKTPVKRHAGKEENTRFTSDIVSILYRDEIAPSRIRPRGTLKPANKSPPPEKRTDHTQAPSGVNSENSTTSKSAPAATLQN